MDWTGCDLVEIDPDKVAGQPVVKGTRVPADVVLIDAEYGRTPEQTSASFPTLELQSIRALLAFAPREPEDIFLRAQQRFSRCRRDCHRPPQSFRISIYGWD